MSVEIELVDSKYVAVRYAGSVLLRADLDAAKHKAYDLMQLHGKLPVMMEIPPTFTGFQSLVSWDDIDVDQYIKQHVVRLAVVGDLRWRDTALLFLFNSMTPFQIEYFPSEQKELALAWLISD